MLLAWLAWTWAGRRLRTNCLLPAKFPCSAKQATALNAKAGQMLVELRWEAQHGYATLAFIRKGVRLCLLLAMACHGIRHQLADDPERGMPLSSTNSSLASTAQIAIITKEDQCGLEGKLQADHEVWMIVRGPRTLKILLSFEACSTDPLVCSADLLVVAPKSFSWLQ